MALDIGLDITGATDFLTGTSSARQYKYQRKLQKHDQEFQKMMSDTAVTRRTQDLKNAGINPILAAGSSAEGTGASAGSVGMQETEGLSIDPVSAYATLKQTENQTEKTKADIKNQTSQTKSEVQLNNAKSIEALKNAGVKEQEINYWLENGVQPGSHVKGGAFGVTGEAPIGYKPKTTNYNNNANSAKNKWEYYKNNRPIKI